MHSFRHAASKSMKSSTAHRKPRFLPARLVGRCPRVRRTPRDGAHVLWCWQWRGWRRWLHRRFCCRSPMPPLGRCRSSAMSPAEAPAQPPPARPAPCFTSTSGPGTWHVTKVTQAAAAAVAVATPVCPIDSSGRMRSRQPRQPVTQVNGVRKAPNRRHEKTQASKIAPPRAHASRPCPHRADAPPELEGPPPFPTFRRLRRPRARRQQYRVAAALRAPPFWYAPPSPLAHTPASAPPTAHHPAPRAAEVEPPPSPRGGALPPGEAADAPRHPFPRPARPPGPPHARRLRHPQAPRAPAANRPPGLPIARCR